MRTQSRSRSSPPVVRVIALVNPGDELVRSKAHHVIEVPATTPLLSAVLNVIPLQIFAYAMAANGRSLSASLVTVEFHADGDGMRQILTEQLAYLDGHEDRDERMRGTDEGLDRLGLELIAKA